MFNENGAAMLLRDHGPFLTDERKFLSERRRSSGLVSGTCSWPQHAFTPLLHSHSLAFGRLFCA